MSVKDNKLALQKSAEEVFPLLEKFLIGLKKSERRKSHSEIILIINPP